MIAFWDIITGRKASKEKTLHIANKFGLLGNWAQDCSIEARKGNWHLEYFVNDTGQITRRMHIWGDERFSTINTIKEIDQTTILIDETYGEGWYNHAGMHKSYVLKFSDDYKTYRSIKSEYENGVSFIEDGKMVFEEKDSSVLHKCG